MGVSTGRVSCCFARFLSISIARSRKTHGSLGRLSKRGHSNAHFTSLQAGTVKRLRFCDGSEAARQTRAASPMRKGRTGEARRTHALATADIVGGRSDTAEKTPVLPRRPNDAAATAGRWLSRRPNGATAATEPYGKSSCARPCGRQALGDARARAAYRHRNRSASRQASGCFRW